MASFNPNLIHLLNKIDSNQGHHGDNTDDKTSIRYRKDYFIQSPPHIKKYEVTQQDLQPPSIVNGFPGLSSHAVTRSTVSLGFYDTLTSSQRLTEMNDAVEFGPCEAEPASTDHRFYCDWETCTKVQLLYARRGVDFINYF